MSMTEKYMRDLTQKLLDGFSGMKGYRKRVFCWLPTVIFLRRDHQDGFIWLQYAYLDEDGRFYRYGVDIPDWSNEKTAVLRRPYHYSAGSELIKPKHSISQESVDEIMKGKES